MKLLLDEQFSPRIAEQMRRRGHDVEAVAGSEHAGLGDPEVLGLARAQRRALVTNNVRDFRPLHAAAVEPGGPGHFGIVFMASSARRTAGETGRIVAGLESILSTYTGNEGLRNAEAWL